MDNERTERTEQMGRAELAGQAGGLELVADFFSRLDRQGPGCDDQTRLALGFIEGLSGMKEIADIGCGTGAQTVVLARTAGAHITAVDLLPQMLDGLVRRASEAGLGQRISPVEASMDDLPFADAQFDMIWAEGSIYNIGFGNGLRLWKRFLKPGGWIAVSEQSWFAPSPPQDIEDHWTAAYPSMGTVPQNTARMWDAGYTPAAQFALPGRCWEENYYRPMENAFGPFLADHSGGDAARGLVGEMRREIEMYRRYKQYCGYVFYIGRAF